MLCDIKIVTDGDEQEQAEQWHCLLYGSDGFTALDGTSYHLHKHTTLHGVQLDAEDQQIAYLRFFCRFVFGAEGPFEIVTDAADLIFPDNASAEIAPISVERGHSGPYHAVYRVQMHYAATLFTCLMAIQMGGYVEMLEDEEVSSNVQRKLNLGYVGTGRFRLPNEAST